MRMRCRDVRHILISLVDHGQAVAAAFEFVWHFFEEADAAEDDEAGHDAADRHYYYYLLEYIPKLAILMINCLVQGLFKRESLHVEFWTFQRYLDCKTI